MAESKEFVQLLEVVKDISKGKRAGAAGNDFLRLLEDIKDLHKRKNAGYAGQNSTDPWANFRMAEMFGVSAFKGCLIRMSDKFIRIKNLTKDSTNDQVRESILDTLMDLSVYSLIGICLYSEMDANLINPAIRNFEDWEDPWLKARMVTEMGVSGFKGALIRINDEFTWLINLTKEEINPQTGEFIRDVLIKLSIYSLIAICLYYEETDGTMQPTPAGPRNLEDEDIVIVGNEAKPNKPIWS